MKQLLSIILILLAFSANAVEKVPLEHFAQKSQFNSFKISPDGKHIAFTYQEGEEVKLAIMDLKNKKIKISFGAGGDDRQVTFFHWATNERVVMENSKIVGWLTGRKTKPLLVAANIDGTKRNSIWDYQRANVRIISILEDDPDHILVGKAHWGDQGGMKLNRMNIFSGKMKYLADSPKTHGTSKSRIVDISVDTNEVPRAAFEWDPVDEDNYEDDVPYLHVKLKDHWEVLELPKHRDTLSLSTGLGFNADNNKFYFLSNYDLKDEGVKGLFELDLKTKKIKLLFRHPDVDITGGIYGANNELIGATYEAGYPGYYYLKDEAVQGEVNFHKSLRASFKGQEVFVTSYDDNKSQATLAVKSEKNPGDFYIYNFDKNTVSYIASSMPKIKPSQMSDVEPFVFNARDGLKMYGQMTIPKGRELKDLPLIIYPHGGPYGEKDWWIWNTVVGNRPQMFANNGYLVIQLNFRGSGGYGDEFEKAGFWEYGGQMIDDIVDVTNWAVSQGYADKDRICIHGVSYGGYASMQAPIKAPDLYKCAIPDAGFYDLELQWDISDGTSKNSDYKEWWFTRMAGKENTEAKLKEYSSAYHLDKLNAAVMIVHGEDDVRVPIENAYDLEKRLKAAGKSYDKMYKEDGHGFRKVKYRIELYEKMLEFLDEHIGEK